MHTVILDGYVDEPACFGVPPYISPYIRYIAGALRDCGVGEEEIHYITIDNLRADPERCIPYLNHAGLIIIIAGMTVPGKYLGGTPITLGEIASFDGRYQNAKIVLGGPIRLGFGESGGKAAISFDFKHIIPAHDDIEAFVFDLFGGGVKGEFEDSKIKPKHRRRTIPEISRWSKLGAFVIGQHPNYPFVMCELETYRGCGRTHHCSFCTEKFYGTPQYRPVDDVIDEVSYLYAHGARYFRIGRQPDLFSYHAKANGRPNPDALRALYSGIRTYAPELRVLHMDNANPGTIARYPDEAREIAEIIVLYNTPGDVAAMGMESADLDVVAANDLKATPDEVFFAIELLNEVGGGRGNGNGSGSDNGLPALLPGINFVHGLKGESKKTLELNYEFLKKVFDAGLMLRRINIRQVIAFQDTPIFGHVVSTNKKEFLKYKERVRKDIDFPMLKRLVPQGTVLTDVIVEVTGSISFGRQLGSYPLLVGIPAEIPAKTVMNVAVSGYGQRSITAIPYPLDINTAPHSLIQTLPYVGKKRAASIARHIPFKDMEEFMQKVDGAEIIEKFIRI